MKKTPAQCRRALALSAATLLLAGCGNVQSALMPAGVEAGKVANLFLVMAIGAFVIWLMVVALAFYATIVNPERHSVRIRQR